MYRGSTKEWEMNDETITFLEHFPIISSGQTL